MTSTTVLVATWSDGLFVLAGETRQHELTGHAVRGLTSDARGGALAIVDNHTLRRRAPSGTWHTLATADAELACCVLVGDVIFLGTEDAQLLRLDANGELTTLRGFDAVPGRETWYAGQALVGGRMVGPPLGIRSITVTADGAVLLANIHVGGIARSLDEGASWKPTIAVDSDVHEVRAHPEHTSVVVAASAVGLCTSHDGGATWVVERDGLPASYCSAVAFAGDDVLVAASEEHFSPRGAVYRRRIDTPGPLVKLEVGSCGWLDGIADTGCIAAKGAVIAIADRGSVYVSIDAARGFACWASDIPGPSSVVIV